jgi:hypothetical protein
MKSKNQIAKGLLIIIFVFLGSLQSQAQVTFKPGLRAGANFSHFTKSEFYNDIYNDNSSNVKNDLTATTKFYIGFYGALKLSKHYTLQPEIDYSSQGTNYKNSKSKGSLNVDYLSFLVMNKFNFSDKFNVHFGPGLDFVVSKNFPVQNDVDMVFILGAGVKLTPNFEIEARAKKGIIPVFYDGNDHTNVVFSLGGTYTFDLK